MIKNVWAGDIALIELSRSGSTEAPGAVLDQLVSRGHITMSKGRPKLTARGRTRADALKQGEQDLRRLYASGGTTASVRTVGGSALHL